MRNEFKQLDLRNLRFLSISGVIKVNQSAYIRLTRPTPCVSENYIKIKINLNFYFHTSL